MEHDTLTMSVYNPDNTICAISTPHGTGGIAVIRVSGPKAIEIVNTLWKGADLRNVSSHTAHLGTLCYTDHYLPLDQCVAIVYRSPRTYTGQDVVELNIHGSKWLQREVMSVLTTAGCRLALPGEFTRRAVSNGRLDLTQAEGVADLIASSSKASHRMAIRQMRGGITQKLSLLRNKLIDLASLLELELDFSEEDVVFADRNKLKTLAKEIQAEIDHLYSSFSKGSAIKDGIPIAIVGATNAGKSSLLNRLLQDERAIVSDIHGTTRDTIEETLE
ncbi:MAG: 50S ribosome-binding GTPase, partial [Duncaniella sp.]|nr:50S ribosome-binding GTPase [Duncaniella sp.]